MRTSVISGIFACTLIIATNSVRAEAAQIDLLQNKGSDTAVTQILALAEIEDVQVKLASEFETTPAEHKVEKGETLHEIAEQYETDWKRLYDKNEEITNPDVISVGDSILIPEVDEELEARDLPQPVVVAVKQSSRSVTNSARTSNVQPVVSSRGSSAGNGYVAGYCTWYVKSRRPDMPNNLGNARTWVSRAAGQGMATGSTPRAGAVAQRNNHVVYVESVNGDGTIVISEMNYRNLYEKTVRTVPANQWNYIY